MEWFSKQGYAPIATDENGRVNNSSAGDKKTLQQRKIIYGVAALVVVVTLAIVLPLLLIEDDEDEVYIGKISDAVTTESIRSFMNGLSQVALAAPLGSRSVVNGHMASLDYVENIIRTQAPSFQISKQPFVVPIYEQINLVPTFSISSPIVVDFIHNLDFNQYRYGGNGQKSIVDASVVFAQNFGCSASDYSGFSGTWVAVVVVGGVYGGCDNYIKVQIAESLGAAGVIIHANSTTAGRPTGNIKSGTYWFEGDYVPTVPVLATTNTVPQMLSLPETTISISTNSIIYDFQTYNLCAETLKGRSDYIVMAGAHLDSVPEGPGLDDDGSGTGLLLEIITLIEKQKYAPKNKIRFCFWSAEEIGLMGSRYYVANLNTTDKEQLGNIRSYVNYDMVASPNFIRYIIDGNTAPAEVLTGSIFLTNLHIDYLSSKNLPYELLPFAFGRSDFVPFGENGVPVSGLFTGANHLKTIAERATFGGMTDAWLDTCYHLSCDDIENIDWVEFTNLVKAASYVMEYLSYYGLNKP